MYTVERGRERIFFRFPSKVGRVRDLIFSSDGKFLILMNWAKEVWVIEVGVGSEWDRLYFVKPVSRWALSSDGKLAIGGEGLVRVLDVESKGELVHLTYEGPLRALAFSFDGKFLGLSTGNRSRIFSFGEDVKQPICRKVGF